MCFKRLKTSPCVDYSLVNYLFLETQRYNRIDSRKLLNYVTYINFKTYITYVLKTILVKEIMYMQRLVCLSEDATANTI